MPPEPAKCRSCGAKIMWVRSEKTDSLMPIDALPNPEGNIVLRAGRAVVLTGDLFEEMLDGERYISHFATCPEAAKHRKKK